MKSPRHQLILLGFICQGFTWDNIFLPAISTLLWLICVLVPKDRFRLNPTMEGVVLTLGCAIGFWLGRLPGQTPHFFLGYGVTLLQAARLVRPVRRREKFFSILCACIQIGVGCTVVLDLRFPLIILAAMWLIPRVFIELEQDPLRMDQRLKNAPRGPGLVGYLTIALSAVALFLVFPRGLLSSAITSQGRGAGHGTLADSMDPTRGGMRGSSKVLLQLQGEHLEPLRCYALVDIKAARWIPESSATWTPIEKKPPPNPESHLHRSVRVKDTRFLGRVLPTDGIVSGLTGDFFQHPKRDEYGMIKCSSLENSRRKTYEYWINPEPEVAALLDETRERLTRYPAQPDRVKAWLAHAVGDRENDLEIARALERYLRKSFTYELGAPRLSRMNFLEEFLFENQGGHCERFAAALGILLRMQGIPSRVVVGYLPGYRNMLTGSYNIRFRDAHAWNEAFIDGRGWVTLDGTPRSEMPWEQSFVRDLFEELDSAWYQKVVSFDGATQKHLIIGIQETFERIASKSMQNYLPLVGVFLAVIGILCASRLPAIRFSFRKPKVKELVPAEIGTSLYYQLLKVLSQGGWIKADPQTPWEFYRRIPRNLQDQWPVIRRLTEVFCDTRYGRLTLSRDEEKNLRRELDELRITPVIIQAKHYGSNGHASSQRLVAK